MEACLDSCANQVDCGIPVAASCAALCNGLEQVYSGACAEAVATLLECEAAMSCAELDAYVEDYGASACAAEYAEMASLCAYQAAPPAECVEFCELAEQCEPEVTVGSCPDNCNLVLGSFETLYGAQCANDIVDLYACYSTVDCDAISELLRSQVPPVACDALNQSVNSSCQ